jgi:hypothetical protein
LRKCRYILGQFDRVATELEQYDAVDRPAYLAWFHRTFGRTLTDLRELYEQIRYRETLLDTIEYLRRWKRLGRYEAYHQAHHMVDNPEAYEEAYEYEDDEADFGGSDGSDSDGSFEDDLAAILEEMIRSFPGFEDIDRDSPEFRRAYEELRAAYFGERREENDSDGSSETGEHRDTDEWQNDGEPEIRRRVQSLYRHLAKRLHPDNRSRAGAPDGVLDELWYRVQDAYRDTDLEALQSIHANLEVRERRDLSSMPVSDILAVHADYKAELRALRKRHRSLRQEPSWGFSRNSPEEMEQLRAHLEAQLQRETSQACSHRDHLDHLLDTYAQPSPDSKGSGRRKSAEEVPEAQLSLF